MSEATQGIEFPRIRTRLKGACLSRTPDKTISKFSNKYWDCQVLQLSPIVFVTNI